MNPKIDKILFSEQTIQLRVRELGEQITKDFQGQRIIAVGILRGAVLFMADLVRQLKLTMELEFIRCSSYRGGTVSTRQLDIEFAENPTDFDDKNVLLIDEILDAGWTLAKVKQAILDRGAKQVKTCVLLDKPARRENNFQADYHGFVIDDNFVVGYGMDYAEEYRNLPYIATIQTSK